MAKRDFLAVTDLSREAVGRLFDLARRMKSGAYRETPLAGKTLAMIFAKSSTRTRVSFEVGTYQLGGHALFLSSRDIRSEEHTSELQSQSNLVCRLLLEKKKQNTSTHPPPLLIALLRTYNTYDM